MRALRPPGDAQHDDQSGGLVNGVDDPQVAGAQAPEVGAGELERSGRSGFEREREDRGAEPSPVSRGEAPELALGGRGDRDAVSRGTSRALAGGPVRRGQCLPAVPYLARASAARSARNCSATMPPSRSYSARASAAAAASSESRAARATPRAPLRRSRAPTGRSVPPPPSRHGRGRRPRGRRSPSWAHQTNKLGGVVRRAAAP